MKKIRELCVMILACLNAMMLVACNQASELDSNRESNLSSVSDVTGVYMFHHYSERERNNVTENIYSVGDTVEGYPETVLLSESFMMLNLCEDNTFLFGGEALPSSIVGITFSFESAQYGTWNRQGDDILLTADGTTVMSFTLANDGFLIYEPSGSSTTNRVYEVFLQKRTIVADAKKEAFAGVYKFQSYTEKSTDVTLKLGDTYEGNILQEDFFIIALYADGTGYVSGDSSFGVLHGHYLVWEINLEDIVIIIFNQASISLSIKNNEMCMVHDLFDMTLKTV